MYIFIDPGNSTGWALFDIDGNVIDSFMTKSFEATCEQLRSLLSINGVKRVLYEEFVLYPWKTKEQMWSEFETVQVIGAIRAEALRNGIETEKLHSRDYPMGFRYQGQSVPSHSNPLHDQLVAHAHGVFWLQKHGIRKPQAR